ncbi:hypothetical protein COT99_03690 [Candidatus Falkowbacteria bacterium CG10_big_fil_rev_8_21_14_0_10_43_10]|uniref:Uncharacterized protein n=1 Tax=Candidatus Falkowbacteria bacterium CG10_big_fil_rev_8_21_14_0_10_43_10 TaxID=1974567 RepID=A0A2H0V3K2_9BACT|nr:MAG: hypothetical protein COT99_03690 [Candidatus Falkowbacteria bacterium CG10_big_fil_rev_8_21_14_0_10_43_10]
MKPRPSVSARRSSASKTKQFSENNFKIVLHSFLIKRRALAQKIKTRCKNKKIFFIIGYHLF